MAQCGNGHAPSSKVGRIRDVFLLHTDAQHVLAHLSLPLIGSHSNQGSVIDLEEADQGPITSDLSAIAVATPLGHRSQSLSDVADGPGTDTFEAASESRLSSTQSQSQHMPLVLVSSTDPSTSCVDLVDSRNHAIARLARLTEDECRGLSQPHLAVLAAQTSRELAKQLKRNKELQEKRRQEKRARASEVARYEKRLKLVSADTASSLELSTSGKSGKRLNIRSILALGLRRNFANIAASDFGLVVLRDMSASTVTRSELRTAAALVMDMRAFCNSCVEDLRAMCSAPTPTPMLPENEPDQTTIAREPHTSVSSSPLPWKLFVTSLRSDGTNSSIWRREKLHVLDATVGIVNRALQPRDVVQDDLSWLSTKRCLCFA